MLRTYTIPKNALDKNKLAIISPLNLISNLITFSKYFKLTKNTTRSYYN